MSNADADVCIGVDGGGTKTVAWLARCPSDSAAEVVGRGYAGPSNPRSVGFETALFNIKASILDAFADAQLCKSPVAAACFCLAGVARAEEKQRVVDWVKEQGTAIRFSVVSDAEAILATSPNDENSSHPNQVALIAGTGSIAWGRSGQAGMIRCGGWGYLLDDAGSGYWLGQRLLRFACETADGRRDERAILNAILDATSCTRPEQLIDWTYGLELPRGRIAQLAKLAFELADSSETAAELIDRGAKQLADLARQIVRKLNADEYSLALAGGVFCGQPAYVGALQQHLRESGTPPSHVRVVENPVQGALNLAIAQLA